jgi:hypothetical protein
MNRVTSKDGTPIAYDRQATAATATRSRSSRGQPTLVATGGGDDFFQQAADTIAASLPPRNA